jgi:hypothetical protein
MTGGKGALGWASGFAGVLSQAYNADLNSRIERDRVKATRDVQVAQAGAEIESARETRNMLNNVLIGVGVLLAFMVAKKALN